MARGREYEFGGTERFAIRRRLGHGGMGVVYEAYDREKNEEVALKTLRSLDAQALYRLKREFRSLQGLEHPNLVSLGELVEEGGEWFFTMELVRGVDFLRYVRRAGAEEPSSGSIQPDADTMRSDRECVSSVRSPSGFREARLRDALRQLAQGLAALHMAGKVHRDIKPSNVLVDADDRVVLLDFGLITEAGSESHSTEAHAVGTAAYMAQEKAAAHAVGPEADWYSVGVVLYEALTGQLPISGPALKVLQEKQEREPPPPRSIAPEAPADLDELCAQLLRFEPSERPSEEETLERLGATAPEQQSSTTTDFTQSPPFVGREDELATLGRAFEDVQRGNAVTVYVHGASGVGKSALIQRFAEEAEEEKGAVVLAGRCYERESVQYKALDGVIDSLSRYMRRLLRADAAELVPRNASLLPRIFPVLGRVEVIAEAPLPLRETKDLHETRRRVFAALRELVERLAERRPAVVVIDDLQWADHDSFLLLDELMRPPDAPSLLLLVSSREAPESLDHAASGAADVTPIPGDVRHLALGPLARGDAVELAHRLLERAGLQSAASAATIAVEAVGHPLFIDELIRHAVATEAAMRESVRLDEAIWARACRLPEETRELLETICTASAPLPQELVRRGSRMDPPEFGRHVAILRVANMVRSKGTRESDSIEPYHNRVREAVLANLDEKARTAGHSRLASVLAGSELAEKRPELLVPHLEAIGDAQQAAAYAMSAAQRAAKALAFDRAVDLYRKA
ncbi:MAG: serine/threonine-protein kinase, partial [Planctomycetota bacterium]